MPTTATPRRPTRVTTVAVASLLVAALAAVLALGVGTGEDDDVSSPETPHWRPSAHLTPRQNWMNDPNGLVHVDGRYHAFYQYNPHGNEWGNMSWGHSSSTDLVHWEEHPVALPATTEEEAFSGSVVYDRDNRSGLGTAENPPLVAVYTSAFKEGSGHEPGTQAQSVAWSTDQGESWQRHPGNPVLSLDPPSRHFRDPKVTWYPEGGYWVMTAVVADDHVVKLYRSDDLLHWDFLSDFRADSPEGVLWEMPELVQVPVEGQPGRREWVMLLSVNPGGIAGGSGMRYFAGTFDGTTFAASDERATGPSPDAQTWLDHGPDFYAATSVSHAPGERPVVIGWMSNWAYAADVPTAPWRGSMAIPRELALHETPTGLVLGNRPAAPVERAAGGPEQVLAHADVDGRRELAPLDDGGAHWVSATLRPGGSATAGLQLFGRGGREGARVSYDRTAGELMVQRAGSGPAAFTDRFSTRHRVPVPLEDGKVRLDVLVDRGSVEVFANGGRTSVTALALPEAGATGLALLSEGGESAFEDVRVRSLGS